MGIWSCLEAHLDTLLHSLFPSPVAVHAGIGGGGRNSSIRCSISRNSFLGTATVALDLSAIAVYCLCPDDAKNMTGTK